MNRRLAILAVLALAPLPALAQKHIFVDWQHTNYQVDAFGIGTRLEGRNAIRQLGDWRLDRDWRLRLAYWHATRGDARSLVDAAVYPTFRLIATGNPAFTPFGEASLGAHLLSRTRIENRQLETAFQFGEQLAFGVRFGARKAFAVALRAEHVSNASIKLPNDGATFYGLELQYDWR